MKRLHLHCYKNSFNTNGTFSGYNWMALESVYVHASYFNVSQRIGNNILYFTNSSPINLADGYYNLESLNDIIKYYGWYKIIPSHNS